MLGTRCGWREGCVCLARERRRRASLPRGDLKGGLCANAVSDLRARRLAAQRKYTPVDLPDARVTGAAPHWAAACSAQLTRSSTGQTSARSWARLMVPTPGSSASRRARGQRVNSALMDASRSSMVTSSVRNSWTWAETIVVSSSGQADGDHGSLSQSREELCGCRAAPIGASSTERGHAGFAEPGRRGWGRVIGQEVQRDPRRQATKQPSRPGQ